MARYQLKLAYDGTDYFGFQRQGNTRTVQYVLESVLRELGWKEETIFAAGRTDTGVHAAGQVVVFSLDWKHGDAKLLQALNAKLPRDVSAREVTPVKAEFHPRYDALSRCYIYQIYQSSARDPLLDRFAWRIWPALDQARLNQAAEMILGRHDFSAFGRAMKPGASTIREVIVSCWEVKDGSLLYKIEANAFLYHMVRRTVSLEVQFARQKITVEQLRLGVQEAQSMPPGLAPSRGLILSEVKYPASKQVWLEDRENLDNMA